MNLGRQRGFTLIELMVALVVSTLLVGMILSIFSRISLAYRGQQQIAGVQQVLAAARATIEIDAKQAGFAVPQGFRVATAPTVPLAPTVKQWPVRIVDSATGPDQIAFFYADSSAQAVVTVAPTAWAVNPTLTVDSATGFAAPDLVVLAKVDTTTNSVVNPGIDPNIATYDSCVMQIATIAGPVVTFSRNAPWGRPDSAHCTAPVVGTLMYKFVAHGYRIDPARPAVGALQQSALGGLFTPDSVNNWQDIAYGFTDIQTALQVFENPLRTWYSGAAQGPQTGTNGTTPASPPLQMTISLVARTDRTVEGIATSATPLLTDPANPDNNTIGNRPSVDLTTTTDPALQGAQIYRYITFSVDFRNMGVGD